MDAPREFNPGFMEAGQALRLACTEVWGGNRQVETPVELPGIQGRLFSHACGATQGGDVHYLSVCGSGLLSRLCLADVAGHGEEVASVSEILHGLFRKHINWVDQRAVLREINRRLCRVGLRAMTTAAAATYYPPWRRLSLSYAGHPPAWLYRSAEGRWQRLSTDFARRGEPIANLPLAADDRTIFSRVTVRVQFGDRLLMHTDGLLEARNADSEQFGAERLGAVLNGQANQPVEDLLEAVISAVRRWSGRDEFAHDDVTALLTEFAPGPKGPALWHALRNRLLRGRRGGGSGSPIPA